MTTLTKQLSPVRWAYKLTNILNAVPGLARFPVDVKLTAEEISRTLYPDDPISMIKGASLPTFEAGLFKAPAPKKGWGIIYNKDIVSSGRLNFTLAHEFGHYLIHRIEHPEGIQCGEQDLVRWDSEYRQMEHEANVFAANLLMPLDDYRVQISANVKADFEMISHCANRYGVSLVAAVLRWLEYTESKSILVVSRDGFILWARSSQPAFKAGFYLKTSNRPPIPVPAKSLAADGVIFGLLPNTTRHSNDVWFGEYCEEIAINSEFYDFKLSLIHLNRY